MLRVAVWLLLVANALYFAWTQGWLASAGLAPAQQREPQRLSAQIHPEALRLLNGPKGTEAPATAPVHGPDVDGAAPPEDAVASGAGGPPVPEAASTACWQAGGFTPPQADSLRSALTALALPAGSWQLDEQRTGGRWVVYMGRYSEELMVRKKTELKELGVEFREVSVPALAPGLALGTFSSEAAAQQALKDLSKKGVNTARVAQERPEGSAFSLRLPAATDAQRDLVAALGAPLAGKTLQRCE
jgi:hypothetical protein